MTYNIVLSSVKIPFFFKFKFYIWIQDDIPITITNKTNYSLDNLKSNTFYNVKIQCITEQGESKFSNPTIFRTNDDCKLKIEIYK